MPTKNEKLDFLIKTRFTGKTFTVSRIVEWSDILPNLFSLERG